jgi:hypothetical protein
MSIYKFEINKYVFCLKSLTRIYRYFKFSAMFEVSFEVGSSGLSALGQGVWVATRIAIKYLLSERLKFVPKYCIYF